MKNRLVVVLILIFGVLGYFIFRATFSVKKPTESNNNHREVTEKFVKGELAPSLTFEDIEGITHNLSELKGKVVILDFWAAWCPYCIQEMPELQTAQDKFMNSLVMIGVHRTDTEPISKGLEFSKDLGISYLMVSDKDGSLYRSVGGFGMPTAVYIDKLGIVSEIKSGPKTAKEIDEKIRKLVE